MIAVISGTSREGSRSHLVANHVVTMYGEMGQSAELIDLAKLPPEAFTGKVYAEKPESLKADFIEKILEAEGLVMVVPEYNGSYPGILKHFIDLLPFPESFECRPVAFIGLAAGYYGGLRAVEQLQMVFAYRNAYLFNRRIFIPNSYQAFEKDGSLKDKTLKERILQQTTLFRAFCKALAKSDELS